MAAFFRHGVSKGGQLLTPKTVSASSYATKAEKKKGVDRKQGPKIDSSAESLAAKGFLRPQKEYIPPPDVEERLKEIFESVVGTSQGGYKVTNLNDKFKLFTKCIEKFDHHVPNSLLHQIETLAELRDYYKTPVDVTTPLDKLRNMDLPENLHVQFEYHRFRPDADKFGETAFPGRSTIVTGLKYKNKYKGHVQKSNTPWF
ncbi:large ribosomal subunit protein mL50 [Cylas formicarius]|uniref:large ribosomal subunit protein mL50 n=1 Tax=Cylas formicarius TaxID=197179 RepID=UPI002958A9E5|nr:large ribosomal subunit protein mL50 [Cylas formicarius]